ncbi:hypothetical protein ILUMI_19051, partial [Ignelater luminosus]
MVIAVLTEIKKKGQGNEIIDEYIHYYSEVNTDQRAKKDNLLGSSKAREAWKTLKNLQQNIHELVKIEPIKRDEWVKHYSELLQEKRKPYIPPSYERKGRHMQRMNEARIPLRAWKWKPNIRRKRGRLRLQWNGQVQIAMEKRDFNKDVNDKKKLQM